MNKFNLFSEAAVSMSAMSTRWVEARNALASIRSAQRFYLPGFREAIVHGRPYAELPSAGKMPFPNICILTEEPNNGPTAISCYKQVEDGGEIRVVSLVRQAKGVWSVYPEIGIQFNPATSEMGIQTYQGPLYQQYAIKKAIHPSEYVTDVNRLTILQVMLSLVNVKMKSVSPKPEKNAERRRSGKLPLYSYHVLNVGGEVWDGHGADDGDGHGYRSHLRRGHIRRLDESRHVWVNPHFVRGSIPGFVDKDYNVTGAAA